MATKCSLSFIIVLGVVLVLGFTTLICAFRFPFQSHDGSKPCSLRKYPAGYVCVCNATYCDTIEDEAVTLSHADQIILMTSSAVSV